MDMGSLLNQLFVQFLPLLYLLWYMVPLFVLSIIFKSAWFKGIFGEFIVNRLINRLLPKDTYHLIKNVTLPTNDGTTQIDHIVVSQYGVFVIETKNIKGWIFGAAKQKQWTQKIFRYTSNFQNPIHQNYKHVRAIERCLALPLDSIFSVVVFVGDSTFKTPMPENVAHGRGVIDYIKSKNIERFSSEQVNEIIQGIEAVRLLRGIKTNREHVAHVKQIVEAKEKPKEKTLGMIREELKKEIKTELKEELKEELKQQPIGDLSQKVCPKCGSPMVLREVKKGANAGAKFWGCSTFPQCRSFVKSAVA